MLQDIRDDNSPPPFFCSENAEYLSSLPIHFCLHEPISYLTADGNAVN